MHVYCYLPHPKDWEDTVVTGVCLSRGGEEGYPCSQVMSWGMGYTLVSGPKSFSEWLSQLGTRTGVPPLARPRTGVTLPPFPARTRTRYPLSPPPLPPPKKDTPWTGLSASGKPLAFSRRRTFLYHPVLSLARRDL